MRRGLFSIASIVLLAACAGEELDTTRVVPERGSLGEEIFNLFYRDLERESPRRAEGFKNEKAAFVGAIDHLFPDGELAEVQAFMERLLPYHDDGTISTLTGRLAAVADRLSKDDDALRSLATIQNRLGYVDTAHQEALELRLSKSPNFRRLSKRFVDFALLHDGLDEMGRPSRTEPAELTKLLDALSDKLIDAEVTEDATRTIVRVADVLLTEDARFANSARPVPAAVVARDPRGMALVSSTNGAVPPPFQDSSPADGLADIDDNGSFVDAGNRPIVLAPFGSEGTRDAFARALAEGGQGELLYRYRDMDRTLLAGVLRDTKKLIDDGIPMKAIRTIDTVMSPRTDQGTYPSAGNKVIDMLDATTAALSFDELPDLLELSGKLMSDHEATLAYLAVELENQLDIADKYNVGLKPGNTFYNDLMRTLRKVLAEPGLAEALLDAVEDPAILQFPLAEAQLSEFKKEPITEGDVMGRSIFTTRVDRARPDVRGNQSIHQRVLHLIADTKGARYEPRLVGIPLGFIFEIPDLAEFYMLSVIGRAEIPPLVSRLTGLAEHPTPEDLAVFINSEQMFGNPKGREGIDVKDNDGDTLFAMPPAGMTTALRPLVQTFYNKGKLDLLFELFMVLHTHYATAESGDYQDRSANQPRYSKLSGIRAYEPLLMDLHRNSHVLAATRKLLIETKSLRTSSGKSARDVLLAFARHLMAIDQNLKTRDGRREVTVDGERVGPLSPFDLIRGSRSALKGVVRRSPATQADWDALVDAVHDTLLATESAGMEAGRFKNPRTVPIAKALLAELESQAKKHARARDLKKWVREDLISDIEDSVTGQTLPALIDLIYAIDADPELSPLLVDLRNELFDEERGFGDLLAIAGDTVEGAKDASLGVPFARFLGKEIKPDTKLVFELLRNGKRTIEADPDEKLLQIAQRGLERAPEGGLYLNGITRAVRQANRANPLSRGPLDKEDLKKITGTTAHYMTDGEHGLVKFYELVKNRK